MAKPAFPIQMPGGGVNLPAAFVVLGIVTVLMAGYLVALVVEPPVHPGDVESAVMVGLVVFAGWAVVVVWVFARPAIDWYRASQVHAAGRDLGLRPLPRPTLDELEEYRGFPLFRYSRLSTRAAVWSMEGRFEGVDLRLIEYAFEGTCIDKFGYKRPMRHVQTVAVLPNAGPRARFYLGPAESEWSELEPGWQMGQGLLGSMEFSRADVPVPPVVHARDDETIEAVFTPQRQDDLAAFEGWVVECCQGTLLVYRHDNAIQPHHLARFLDMVARIAEIMRPTAGWTPANAGSPRDDRPEPPRRGIRREEDY